MLAVFDTFVVPVAACNSRQLPHLWSMPGAPLLPGRSEKDLPDTPGQLTTA
jgi:hypothetical protein